MTELATLINTDQQPFRALFNYLSQMEGEIDFKRLSNGDIVYETIENPIQFYDFLIDVILTLKSNPRNLLGFQSEDGEHDIILPSNN